MGEINSGNGDGHTFDWEQLRRRLSSAQSRLSDDTTSLEVEDLQRIWKERAQRFAEAPTAEDKGEHVELLVVRLGDEYYGLEANYVFRIRPATQITRVPRAPVWIRGVANERGRILSVFDLRRFLGLPVSDEAVPLTMPPSLVIIETPEMELALLADGVLNVLSLPVSEIQETSDAMRGIPQPYVSGVVNPTMRLWSLIGDEDAVLIVLNMRALLADEHLRVHEEIV